MLYRNRRLDFQGKLDKLANLHYTQLLFLYREFARIEVNQIFGNEETTMTVKELKILIVDSKQQSDALLDVLSKFCRLVKTVHTPQLALDLVTQSHYDVVLTEFDFLGGITGLDLLREIKALSPVTEVVVVTNNSTIDSCKNAIRAGAYDYLTKPITSDEILNIVDGLGCLVQNDSDDAPLQVAIKEHSRSNNEFVYDGVLSRCAAVQHIYKVIKKVAKTNLSVLIEGESGSGKEFIARSVHLNSPRSGGEYQPVNCAGLSETLLESELFGHAKGAFTGAVTDRKGLFEVADKGTLFFDEIGDMPLNMQAKLLRVLEDGVVTPVGSAQSVKVDVRVVSATNHDLAKLVEEKKFRQDLYFRIKGVSVTMPPLRNRPEDIPDLVYYFLSQACEELGVSMMDISESAMDILLHFAWPGNVRQLRHAIRVMVVMCEGDMIDVRDVPPEINKVIALNQGQSFASLAGKPLSEIERNAIGSTLKMVDGNREKASKMLGIGERTLYRKIKEYDL